MKEGWTVAICELPKCQPDIVQDIVMVMEDWHAGRRASAESPASYNNFSLADLVREQASIDNLIALGIGGGNASSASSRPVRGTPSSFRPSPYVVAEPPSASASASASASRQPLPPPPLPPTPPPTQAPAEEDSVASGSSSPAAGIGRPIVVVPWGNDVQWYIDTYELDQSAQDAMADLSMESEAELMKALRKLTNKQDTDPVRNPSAFVAIACRKALGKVRR